MRCDICGRKDCCGAELQHDIDKLERGIGFALSELNEISFRKFTIRAIPNIESAKIYLENVLEASNE